MKCEDKIGEYCRQAITYGKYAKYRRRYKLKILRIYLWVIWTFAGLVNMDGLVKKEDIDDRLIALISLVFMILPTLFYILNS